MEAGRYKGRVVSPNDGAMHNIRKHIPMFQTALAFSLVRLLVFYATLRYQSAKRGRGCFVPSVWYVFLILK